MCIAGINRGHPFYSPDTDHPLNESQASPSTRQSSPTNPCPNGWADKLRQIGNISSEFTTQKWESFPALQQAIINMDSCKYFVHDHDLQKKIADCQRRLREIDLCFVGEILTLHYDKSTPNRINPELRGKIKHFEETLDLIFNTLSDIKKSDRIINGEASSKSFFSKRTITAIALTIVGTAIAVAAFILPLAIPILIVSAPLLFPALNGLRVLISCIDGSLNICDILNNFTSKSAKAKEREFTDAFSKLYEYLNEIKFIGIANLAAKESESVSDQDTLRAHTQIQQQQWQITVQQLQEKIEALERRFNIQRQTEPSPDTPGIFYHVTVAF